MNPFTRTIRLAAAGLLLSAVVDAGPAQAQRSDLRMAGLLIPARRDVLVQGAGAQFGEARATMSGGDLLLQGGGAGLHARYLSASFADGTDPARGDLSVMEIGLLLGAGVFSVELAHVRYARQGGVFGEADEALWRIGGRSSVPLGPSGLTVSARAGVTGRVGDVPEGIRTVRKGVVAGVDAETAVLYQFPNRMPFFVMLGYRMGYLMPTKGKPDPGEPREELSGVVFGGGMRVVR